MVAGAAGEGWREKDEVDAAAVDDVVDDVTDAVDDVVVVAAVGKLGVAV